LTNTAPFTSPQTIQTNLLVDRQSISDDNLAIEQADQLIQPTGFREQPTEPTVVDRQSMTFDNPAFADWEDNKLTRQQLMNVTDLIYLKAEILDRTIAASESAGEPPLESYRTPGISLKTLREMERLTNNPIKTKTNIEASYVELRKEEGL